MLGPLRPFFFALLAAVIPLGPLHAQGFAPLAAPAPGLCEKLHWPEAVSGAIVPTSLDARLFDHALRVETNHRRCLEGLAPVAPSDALALESTRHALWLAEAGGVAHESNVPGRETPVRRAQRAGFGRFSAENIAWLPWMGFPKGGFVEDTALGRCGYREPAGAVIRPHTYASFAAFAVDEWMGSPGHRANLLAEAPGFVGAGVAFDSRAPHCGNITAVQLFAD